MSTNTTTAPASASDLTLAEVLDACLKLGPTRSYCAKIEQWMYEGITPGRVTYQISVLPGFDDSQCSSVDGASFGEALATLNHELCSPAKAALRKAKLAARIAELQQEMASIS